MDGTASTTYRAYLDFGKIPNSQTIVQKYVFDRLGGALRAEQRITRFID